MKRDLYVRFCENLRVKLPWVTRLWPIRQTPQVRGHYRERQKYEISITRQENK
jgi:hypothetical protein